MAEVMVRGAIVMLDEHDLPLLAAHRWIIKRDRHTSYVQRGSGRTTIMLHRAILGASRGQLVDHKNHDGLDNRRANLRLCDARQNCANTRSAPHASRFRGVTWHKGVSKWQAQIRVNRKGVYLGLFSREEDAASAYDAMARQVHGEFACLNFPQAAV